MNIQIFGRKDCPDSRTSERWFKERSIPFQFVDLKQKGLSPRELESVARPIGIENLLDRQSNRFKSKGLAFMSPSRINSVLLEDPVLLKTPIVRNGKEATLGFCPDTWQVWRNSSP
jgi:arsenate reductase (glutaredoxin)